MARIRSLKPEFWDDRKLARSTSRDARMLYMGMWNQADEHGRLNGDAAWLKGRVFPFDDDIEIEDIKAYLDELEGASRLQRYEAEGDPFIFLPKLGKHQRLEPAKVESRLPEPPKVKAPNPKSEPRAHESAPDADECEPEKDSAQDGLRLSMEHVAGSMDHVGAKRPAQTRPRDQLWDAIVEVCGIEGTPTKSAAGEIANAKKQLAAVDAVPGQVRVRANRYRQRYPDATLTPSALAKHWSALGDSEPPPPPRRINPMNELSKANRP